MTAPGTQLGAYEVARVLKRGGMGEVLLARQRAAHGFERPVAIKTIRADLQTDPSVRSMFLDEARLMARIHHPCVTQVFDFGQEGDLLYLVLEYVAGIALTDLVRLRPPPLVALQVISECCRGLHSAHELKDDGGRSLDLVHRDISPSNLMLTFDGCVKILDFGIALTRARMTPQTEYGSVRGKPPYLSPEQLHGRRLDRRVDVFATTTVLYELLTGQRPFAGDSAYAVAIAMDRAEATPPSELVRGLPSGIDQVVLKGLARDRELRYQTAADLADALDALVPNATSKLPSYTEQTLVNERLAHQRLLQEAFGQTNAGLVRRPTGVPTAQGRGPNGVQADAAALGTTQTTRETPKKGDRAENTAATVRAPGASPTAPPDTGLDIPRRTWPILLSLGLLAAGVTGATLWATAQRSEPARTEVTPAPDTHPATPHHDLDAARVGGPDAAPRDAVLPDRGPRARKKSPVRRKPTQPVRTPSARPARSRPADAAVASAFGYLSVSATPYARVRIDGKDVDVTPLIKHRLPVGRHLIVLMDPETKQVRMRRQIVIAKDKGITLVAKPLGRRRAPSTSP